MGWVRCVPQQSTDGRAHGELFRCPDCGVLFRVKVVLSRNVFGLWVASCWWRRAWWWQRWQYRRAR